jgi:hypothetical protein
MSLPRDLELANHALILLGERPLASLDDPGVAAQAVRAAYGPLRDHLLAERPWHWSRQFADLPRLAAAPSKASGQTAAYRLPSPCFRIVTAYVDAYDLAGDWTLEPGRLLVSCDASRAVTLEFHGLVPERDWPAAFRLAFSYRLAADLAVPITTDLKLRDLYLRDGERELARARHQASTERPGTPVVANRLMTMRGR